MCKLQCILFREWIQRLRLKPRLDLIHPRCKTQVEIQSPSSGGIIWIGKPICAGNSSAVRQMFAFLRADDLGISLGQYSPPRKSACGPTNSTECLGHLHPTPINRPNLLVVSKDYSTHLGILISTDLCSASTLAAGFHTSRASLHLAELDYLSTTLIDAPYIVTVWVSALLQCLVGMNQEREISPLSAVRCKR